jgi:hypothetical protein
MNDANDPVAAAAPRGRAPRADRRLLLVGLSVYFALVWYIGWREVGEELAGARIGLAAAAAAIIFGGNWARAAKWRYALGPGRNAVGIFFLSKIAGEWSPGRLGEFSPLLLKRHRTPEVAAWILLDRLLEIATTLALGLIGLAVIRLVPPAATAGLAAFAAAGFGAAALVLTRRAWLEALAVRLTGGRLRRFAGLLAAVSAEIGRFGPKLPLAFAVTVAAKITDLWAVVILFHAFGQAPGFALVAAAKCALAVVSFIPLTPLATGLPHLTQAGLMHAAAGVPYDALAAAIGVEVVIVTAALWTSGGIAAALSRGTTAYQTSRVE